MRNEPAWSEDVSPEALDALKGFAASYIWWKSPGDAVASPDRVIAQVMDIGDYDDVLRLAALIGDDRLRQVLARAQPGWFSERSWTYWHLRLGLAPPGALPARAARHFA